MHIFAFACQHLIRYFSIYLSSYILIVLSCICNLFQLLLVLWYLILILFLSLFLLAVLFNVLLHVIVIVIDFSYSYSIHNHYVSHMFSELVFGSFLECPYFAPFCFLFRSFTIKASYIQRAVSTVSKCVCATFRLVCQFQVLVPIGKWPS